MHHATRLDPPYECFYPDMKFYGTPRTFFHTRNSFTHRRLYSVEVDTRAVIQLSLSSINSRISPESNHASSTLLVYIHRLTIARRNITPVSFSCTMSQSPQSHEQVNRCPTPNHHQHTLCIQLSIQHSFDYPHIDTRTTTATT